MAGDGRRTDARALEALLDPASIAVIGASADPMRIGGRTVHFLLKHGFEGRVFPVNPQRAEVQGLLAYPTVAELPERPALAVISVSAAHVIGQLEACAAKGVKAAVVFSSGFAEAGEAGAAMQARIGEIARETGLRILGPNCLGVMSLATKVFCTFGNMPDFPLPPAGGGVSLISQSGAFGIFTFMAAAARGLPFDHWIATGNEADVDFADCVALLARDPSTRVIMGYMEGCRDGRRLMQAFDLARQAGKPVVIMKVGRTHAGAAAAASHTAALAGSDAVFDAVFRQHGVFRARTVDEFFDVGYACLRGRPPTSDRIGLISGSGGAGVLMADAAQEAGLDVAELPAAAQAEMRAMVAFSGTRNPVDTTGQAANDPTLFPRFLDVMIREGGYGAIGCFQGISGIAQNPLFFSIWEDIRARHPDTPFFMAMQSVPEARRRIEALGVPVFEEPTRMVRAIAALRGFAEPRSGGLPLPEAAAAPLPARGRGEGAASDALEAAGLPMAPRRVVTRREEASTAARAFGFPVVLKVVSPDIAHKAAAGGVMLGLADDGAVERGFDALLARVAAARPDAHIEGVMVAPMISGGVEMIVGASNDPVFGPVVMAGLGGVMVELFGDVAFRTAPLTRDAALAMVAELRGAALLEARNGRPAADREALADAIVALGDFAVAHRDDFDSIEINPLSVREAGAGVVGLDALIV